MLLAYIDEIGEPGAFVSKNDKKYNTSPAFGYAGFVVPERSARFFGSEFTHLKRDLFKQEHAAAAHPGQWEKKGSSMFRADTWTDFPHFIRAFAGLVTQLVKKHSGRLFYYADEKPIGTPGQTRLDMDDVEARAMQETLNRLGRYADHHHENIMVMIDQINEDQRERRALNMYGHIIARAADKQEMYRIVEPPMHVDSVLSANIQFADWVAAAVSRAIDHQLIDDSRFTWVPQAWGRSFDRSFTLESKLHLSGRSVRDLMQAQVFHYERPVHPLRRDGQRLSDAVDPAILRRIYGAAQARSRRP